MQPSPDGVLSTADHSRGSAGLTYVYPVVSRRAGGLSIGVNLNPNNACNWRCIYCQVPNLTRGTAPRIDLQLLEDELRRFVADVLHGDFLVRRTPTGMRRLNDIALSGNGEPTSAGEIADIVALIGRVRRDLDVPHAVKTVLLTNGSLVHRSAVQAALHHLAELSGEVWFKIDRATAAGMRAVNGTSSSMTRVQRNLETAARLCPTWIQTCLFALDGQAPSEEEVGAYLSFLADLRRASLPVHGVHLYGIARPSMQPQGSRLAPLPEAWLRSVGERIGALGFVVHVSP